MECEEIDRMFELEDTHWWFSAKRELVLDVIRKLKPSKVLDVGCGTGAGLASISGIADAYGCEYSSQALAYTKRRGNFPLAQSNAEELPFKDESFDAVTILDVLEHLDDDLVALEEINRIVKKGGYVIINVPAHMFLWQKADELLHHKRRYSFSELKEKVLSKGFEIEKLTYWNFLLFPFSAAFKIFGNGENIKKHGKVSNTLLHTALSIDNFLISHGAKLPFGVSLFCIARKI